MYQIHVAKNNNHINLIRLTDNASIPIVADNRDFQVYLDWKAQGNQPIIDNQLYAFDGKNQQFILSDTAAALNPGLPIRVSIP